MTYRSHFSGCCVFREECPRKTPPSGTIIQFRSQRMTLRSTSCCGPREKGINSTFISSTKIDPTLLITTLRQQCPMNPVIFLATRIKTQQF